MQDSHYRISLDIHSTQSQVSLPVMQGDTNRKVLISLCEGGKPYHIEDDCFAVFSAKKSDGKIIENNCIIADNVIEYAITEQTSAASGKVDCNIKLYGADRGLITSPRFTIIVDSRAVGDAQIESTSQYSALTELYTETNALKTEVENKLANGEFDGEDVDYSLVTNALKGTESGEIVTLTDVSPFEHEMKVKVKSKNMIMLVPKTTEQNGITFVEKSDGSVAVTGTATDNAFIVFRYVLVEANKKYWISSGVSGSSGSTYQMCADCGDIGISNIYHISTASFVPAVSGKVSIYIYVYKGNTVNLTFYPMINEGEDLLPFTPYVNPSTANVVVNDMPYTPNSDGTVSGVTSLYPTTILTTDTAGVTIEAEYNRDINKVIAQIQGNAGRIAYIDLKASKWQGSASLYSQVVSIEGVTENSKIDINPSIEQLAIFHAKDIAFVAENEDGTVTVYCVGQKPTADYQMQITITEVSVNG